MLLLSVAARFRSVDDGCYAISKSIKSGIAVKPIFISYSSKHRDLTRALAGVIEEQYGAGSVW